MSASVPGRECGKAFFQNDFASFSGLTTGHGERSRLTEQAVEIENMRTFAVYQITESDFEAVKIGFSWPAFIFCPLWAFGRQLWFRGMIVAVFYYFSF